jgi:molecular chaperone GrpE
MDPVNDQSEQAAPAEAPTPIESEAAADTADASPAAAPAEDGAVDGAVDSTVDSAEPVEEDEAESGAESGAESEPAFRSRGVALDEIIDMEKLGLQKAISERDEQISSLQQQLAELTARLRTVSAAYKKQQDDVTATRKRLERHAAQREEVRRGEVVSGLFEPVENLRRSREALAKAGVDVDNLTGLDMVLTQFMTAFDGLGLEEVPGKGARFNPNLHEALTMMPVMDPALDDVVVEVFSAGYRVGSRLIQPARVIVGSYTAPEPEDVPEAVEVIEAEVIVAPEPEASAEPEPEASAEAGTSPDEVASEDSDAPTDA